MQQEAIIFARLKLLMNFGILLMMKLCAAKSQFSISHCDCENYMCFYELSGPLKTLLLEHGHRSSQDRWR